MTKESMPEKKSDHTGQDSPRYKTAEFNVAASDDKGHFSKVVFNVQPALAQQANLLYNSRMFPYDSLSSLLRHALLRHIRWLQAFKEPVKSVMGQVNVINKLLDEDEHASQFLSTFNKLSQRINEYIGLGDKGEAVRLIMEVTAYIREMPDTYWKKKYIEELDKRCGGYIRDIGKADLLEFSIEPDAEEEVDID